MRRVFRAAAVLLFIIIGGGLLWRREARFRKLPCPAWLAWLIENPITESVASSSIIFERTDLKPDMRVLDVGAGLGRLTIPAAKRVGPDGYVLAVDIQEDMLRMLEERTAAGALTQLTL